MVTPIPALSHQWAILRGVFVVDIHGINSGELVYGRSNLAYSISSSEGVNPTSNAKSPAANSKPERRFGAVVHISRRLKIALADSTRAMIYTFW